MQNVLISQAVVCFYKSSLLWLLQFLHCNYFKYFEDFLKKNSILQGNRKSNNLTLFTHALDNDNMTIDLNKSSKNLFIHQGIKTVENTFLYFNLIGRLKIIASLEKKARTKYNQNTTLQSKGRIIKINITYGKEGWSVVTQHWRML